MTFTIININIIMTMNMNIHMDNPMAININMDKIASMILVQIKSPAMNYLQ